VANLRTKTGSAAGGVDYSRARTRFQILPDGKDLRALDQHVARGKVTDLRIPGSIVHLVLRQRGTCPLGALSFTCSSAGFPD
jgi:hypothetical protein